MTKREIVKATINHKETDRVPYFVTFLDEASEKIKIYYPGDDFNIAIGNYVYPVRCPFWQWDDLPASYKEFDPPEVLPGIRGYGSYEILKEKLQYIREKTDCYILVLIYGSHFEKAYFARGIENFLADLAYNKNFAKKLLDKIIRINMVMLETIITLPEIDGILLGSDWGSQKSLLMSPDIWRELIAPGELMEYELIRMYGYTHAVISNQLYPI
jgi:uroporphyrinogen decarboxylase